MIKITEAPEPTVPKGKKVIIGDLAEGKIEPHIRGDRLWWHCCITPHDRGYSCCSYLLQGHGYTPEEAVASAIVQTRNSVKGITESLARIERELGTAGQTDDDVLRMGRGGAA